MQVRSEYFNAELNLITYMENVSYALIDTPRSLRKVGKDRRRERANERAGCEREVGSERAIEFTGM